MRLFATVGALLIAALIFAADSPLTQAQALNNDKKELKTVEVERGDILARIAKRNETTFRRLFDANLEIKDPDVIYPGDKVRIPHPGEELKRRPLPNSKPAAKPASKKQASRSTGVKPVTPKKRVVKRQAAQYVPAPAPASTVSGGVWDRLAACESGGNWSINTSNGYYGGLQFSLSSWQGVGGSGYPHQASKSEQIARAEILKARQGWGAWPACTAKLGLR